MPRGDYQVENAEACKPAPQDNSYKMCLVTIGIFFLICIILLLCTLPLKGGQTTSRDEYKADPHEGTREIPEEGYQAITTKRTTAAKYQEVTKPNEQLPTTVTPRVKTKSTKSTPVTSTERTTTAKYQEGTHEILEGDYHPVASTEGTTTPKYQEGAKAHDQPPLSVTPYEETENTEDDETNTISTVTPQQKPEKAVAKDIAENSNTSSTLSVLQNRTTSENDSTTDPYLPKEETDFTVEDKEWKYFSTPTVNDDQYNVTLSDNEKNEQTNTTEDITPEVENKEQKYFSTPTVNDNQYNVTLSDDEKNEQTNTTEDITPEVENKEQKYFSTPTVNGDQYNVTLSDGEQTNITENITPEVEDEEHVPLHENEHEYNETTPVEGNGDQTEEGSIHEGLSTKSYQLANETKEDGATVSTVTEYENSTSNEQSLFVKDIYAYEGNATSTTDGYTKDEEEHTQAAFSVDEVEDNRTTSAEEMYNQTTQERNSEDKKVITAQITTPIDDQITYKDSEPSTENTVVLHQNQTDNENVSLTEESHMEEELGITNAYTKEDEAEHQLVTPAPNNSSTEDDTTDQENSTQTASEVQSDAQKPNNSDTKDDTHVTNLTTEDKMTEAITEVALKTTTKQSLQTTVSADTPVCVLPNVTSNATRGNVCFTSKCKSQAKHLMKTMSFNVDACEDFYEFACGDVRTNKYLQPENLEQNTWDRIRSSMKKDSSIAGDKFKSFYNQCLYYDSITKEERINQAIEILQTVGTFYNSTSWKTNSSNFTQLFLNMLQLHSTPLFDVLLDVDNTKGERFDFQIIPPLSHSLFQDVAETELHCREDILHDYRNKKTFLLNHAYEEYMNCTLYPEDLLHKITEALEKFSAFESHDEEEDTALVRLRQAIEFSILPCKRSLPNKREMLQKLLTKDFHSTTIKELNSLYPMIEWDILLEGLLGKQVPENLAVQLYFKDYFDELFHNMKTVEMYELHNAVLALFAQELYFNLVETKGACHRPSYCLKVASTLMQDVSSFLYLSSFTQDELQNFDRELQEISKKIKTAFKHIVEEEDTLLTAQDKIEEMEIITNGGMDIFGVKGFVESLLNDTEIDDADGYLINAVKLTRRYRKNMYQLFFKSPRNDESIWTHFVHPYSFQPVAIYPLNMVVIPYGYLGALQSYDSLMGYMRNVRLAIPLAQHMIHHFDTTGKMFNTSHLNYEMFEYCLDLSYSSQRSWKHPETKQIMDFKVDAPLFHNQRLTDFLALRTVLEAYKTEINSEKVLPWLDLNQEQIYFLVFTQTLCTKSDLLEDVISLFEDEYLPPTLRVPDIMSNSEEFGAAYHCGVGIAMNPENKCKLFSTEELASYGSYEDVPKEQTANSQEVH